ncbi:MAG: GAF domain-containing protein [bacterium]|nr:GAF domain-containing protein [bacterium]
MHAPDKPTAAEAALAGRYRRLREQLLELFRKTDDPVARMATACAVLHHKQPHFFWTGFYRLQDGKLVVGPYQGPLACSELAGPQGVCWAAVTNGASVVVADVHAFPGHVACDSRSQSEIVVPVRDAQGNLVAVLDVDSDRPAAFSEVDREGLEAIVTLIHAPEPRD